MNTTTSTTPHPSRPASIVPSITSVLSDATTITGPAHTQRGFKSRESYLAALQEFADRKSHMESNERTLVGWYGVKTMDDYKARTSLKEERRKRKDREEQERQRRRTLVGMDERDEGLGVGRVIEGNEGAEEEHNELSNVETRTSQKEGRMRRLSRVFTGGRRPTVA